MLLVMIFLVFPIGEANFISKVLYAKNLFSFIRNLYSKDKKNFNINLEDEIIEKTLIKKV